MVFGNWLIWDRIREYARSNRVYQQERIFQDQSNLDRITTGGEFFDFSSQSAILEQTNLQINRLERYKDYEQMDQTGEISLALDLYADELSLIDPEHKHSIVIRANNTKIKEELEELYYSTLLIDQWTRPAARYLCKFGDSPFEIIPNRDRSGVSAMRFMNIYNFTRVETKFGDLVGFYYQDEFTPEPLFMHPWSVMHMRLSSFENAYNPYGRSILDGARKPFKQLRLMEDSALIYRITRSAEKRKYKIPVGLMPSKEVPEYLQSIARMYKRRRFYNPSTNTFDENYSPIVQEDDFFLPFRPDGTGPDIETLPGAENLDQIADIEYFKKKMIGPLKIPFARVGIGEGSGEANEKSLSQSSAEFAKAVKWIQSTMALGLQKVGIVHLALRGYSVEDIRGFEISLASSSALEDLYRMETWQSRTSVMMDLKDIGWFPKEWIVTRFTDLSPDEIEELNDMEEDETGGGGGGGGGGLGGLDGPDMDAGDDIGGDTQPDVDESSDDANSGPEEDILSGGDALSDDALEGYNYAGEKRVIIEARRLLKRKKRNDYVTKLYEKKNKVNSAFPNLLESKELDGLSKSKPPVGCGGVFNPNKDDGILIEWSVSEDERTMVLEEVSNLLKYTSNVITENISDDVLVEDLP